MFGTIRRALQFLGLLAGWALLIYVCLHSLTSMKSVASFDPYEILELTVNATDRQIKKAFRTMSLKYHPDKNRNDASAAAKFLLISKAYHTLTDEVARTNFEKFGNPDGVGLMRVGIGLPKFLVREEAQLFVLALFTFILLVTVPLVFVLTYRHYRQYTASGLAKETVSMISLYLRENPSPTEIMLLIAISAEARALPFRQTDLKELEDIERQLNAPLGPELSKLRPTVRKPFILMIAYWQKKTHLLSRGMKGDLESTLRLMTKITHVMLDLGFISNWFRVIQAVLRFRRGMVQCLEPAYPAIFQLPHIGKDPARTRALFQALQSADVTAKDLRPILKYIVEKKTKLLSPSFTAEEIADIVAFYHVLPEIELEASIEVQDEKEIAVRDMVCCDITITRLHLKEGEKAGPAHSPFFPDLRAEDWTVFIASGSTGTIESCERVKSAERTVKVRMYFQPKAPGTTKINITCCSETYFGVDKSIVKTIEVVPAEDISTGHYVHPEDVFLDEEPTLVQSVIGGPMNPEQASSDSDDDGDGE